MKTLKVAVLEFDHSWEALQQVAASGQGKAILLDGKPVVVSQADADRLAVAGIEFAYLVDHRMPDGNVRMMTIPVN